MAPPIDVPPSPPPVKVPTSREEADSLLLELGRLDALEARNQADCDKAVAAVVAQYAARNKVSVDGSDVAIADRRFGIKQAVTEWANGCRAELLSGKSKSFKLNHGEGSWRKVPDKLEPVDGQSSAGRSSLLDELHTFLVAKLQKFEDLTAAALGCLSVQIKWRHSDLTHALQDKRVQAAEARKIGFKLVETDEETFTLKPSPVELASQSAHPSPAEQS